MAGPDDADLAGLDGGRHRQQLHHHILRVLGRRPLSTLRKSDVEALCAALALAPSTVGTVHQHFGQLLASAVEDGLMGAQPGHQSPAAEARAVEGPAGAARRRGADPSGAS